MVEHSNTIARYGIETSDSGRSPSPLYTAPNSPSSIPTATDNIPTQMTMEAEDRVFRLESRLAEAREQAQIQQNTLDDILQLLQNMPGLKEIRTPENPVMTPRTPAPTDMNSTLNMQARGLKPATPSEFDRDWLKGRAFLNSCRLYRSLCDCQGIYARRR